MKRHHRKDYSMPIDSQRARQIRDNEVTVNPGEAADLAGEYLAMQTRVAELELTAAIRGNTIDTQAERVAELENDVEHYEEIMANLAATPTLHQEVVHDLAQWLTGDRWQVGHLEIDDVAFADNGTELIVTVYATVVTAQGRSPFVMGVV